MNTRVKLLRKELNMSQEAFGAKLGVTGAGISKIESGQRNLTEQMLLLICKEFHINEMWLKHGEGDIYKQQSVNGLDQLIDYYNLDDLDRRIIYEYTRLDDKKRKVIKDYIMSIAYGRSIPAVSTRGNEENELPRCAEGEDNNRNTENVLRDC